MLGELHNDPVLGLVDRIGKAPQLDVARGDRAVACERVEVDDLAPIVRAEYHDGHWLAQLARLPEFLHRRRSLVDRYFAGFATDPACLLPPRPRANDGQSWNMFSMLLPLAGLTLDRKAFRDALAAEGIMTGVSYEALHLSTLGRRFGYHRGDLPNTERIADSTVTLPLHAAMTDADVDRVCAACADIIARHKR